MFLCSSTGRNMFTYSIRISHDVVEAYQIALAQTFKDFQVYLFYCVSFL